MRSSRKVQLAAAIAIGAAILGIGASAAHAVPGKNGSSCSNGFLEASVPTIVSLIGDPTLTDYDTLAEAGSVERFVVGNIIDTTGFADALTTFVDVNGDGIVCVSWTKAGPGALKHQGLDDTTFTNVVKFLIGDNGTNAS